MAAAADITGTITLKGTPPAEKEIVELAKDPSCGKLHTAPVKTKHYVVGPNGQLANVVVYLKGISGKSTGASAKPVVLDQKGCEYVPQILAVQTGQTLLVRNSDPLLHNVHNTPTVKGNPESNLAQLAGAPDLKFTFSQPEMFIRFKCDVHPWMFAWVSVFAHPYFAVTDAEGKFKIADVPPGKYTLEVVHRKAGSASKEIEVADQTVTVDFTLDAK